MRNLMKMLVAVSLFIALAASYGVRYGVDHPRYGASPAIHHMIAANDNSDIGDGTSPSKKG